MRRWEGARFGSRVPFALESQKSELFRHKSMYYFSKSEWYADFETLSGYWMISQGNKWIQHESRRAGNILGENVPYRF